MRDAARPLMTLALVVLLLGAGALTFRGFARIDPRGRAAWAAAPLVFEASPRDLTVFLPACDVHAVVLHPTAGSRGRLSIDYFRDVLDRRGEVWPSGMGGTEATVTGAAPVVLPMRPVEPSWRQALTLRVRLVDAVGQPAAGAIALDPVTPVSLEAFDAGALGRFACAFDGGSRLQAWSTLGAQVWLLVASALLSAAWLARALGRPTGRPTPRAATLTAATMVGATALTYMLVVPPFEPPDELAHLQYARYVATTGTLPHTVPAPGDQWRPSSYEWVQHPLYYLGAAAVLKATGLETPAPALAENPRSRVRPNGTEPTLFHHAAPPMPPTGHEALRALRLLSCLMAVATALVIARLLQTVTDDGLVVATVAGGLALMPQWDAVMGAVSTDPPATLLAALATLAIARLARGRANTGWLLMTGAFIGAAYAVKATAVFLAPMAVLACVLDAANRERFDPAVPLSDQAARILGAALRPVLLVGVGIAATAAWVHVRAWLVFGDPQAFAFKKAILEAGGFVPMPGPMPWTREFWAQMRVMVFEPFWARFGSLGAGPFPDSRVWAVYTLASLLLVLVAAWGAVAWMHAAWKEVRTGRGDRASCTAMAVAVCGVGVALGLAAWVAVNLAPRADMVVHWTPRHILPLTAPAALLVGAGLERMRTAPALPSRVASALVGAALLALGLAGLGVFRATVLMFHFGY